ncbi:efflux RND transporter permease subunit [Azospirillum sp. RWY-5-1]|uniref:Efflux RND transporter permease subunit n=1 Tax=Azospirillum oleiclasticum TaxID=2735135 RepID=A0ABX2TAW5_9PROT|nr:efflux RND transporter permease subunit [Azospirillum oleiclasticum]NYZ13648.1 efflux RND transporter permease subunit [Azospirillum oleiclasticum]NYZ20920.1 efflux RND transporter permease subunit [Azospirillum oleiclasticum]
MTRLILRNPLAALAAILILCLLGAVSVFRIPVQMIPDISPRRIVVETNWPGATPQDVEQEILIDQETFLRAVPGLVRMSSTADFGGGMVELEFPPGVSIDEALIHIDNALSQVTDYPETVDRPRILAESSSDEPFLFFGVERLDGAVDAASIQRETNWIENVLRPRLERVPGVSKAEVIGGAAQEIHIELDPLKLAARGINVGTVRDAIRARNRDVSGGDRDFGKRRYFLRTIGRFADLEDLAALTIARENGTAIRLRDVGTVALATREARSLAFADGRPTLLVTIRKRPGANVIAVKDAITAAVDELNRHALKERGLVMRLLSEDVRYMVRSIDNVLNNLIAGGLLAGLVLLLFLRSVPATVAAAASMPVCTLATLLVLAATGRTINVISLSGVAFAIGMTLDNSVVALDSIARHLRMGKTKAVATAHGLKEVWPAILSSTLTTVLVFLPVMFITVEAGQLYSDIAIAITGAVMTSMLVALVLVPIVASRWPIAPPEPERRRTDGPLAAAMGWMLGGVWRECAILGATAAAMAAVLLHMVPPAEYLPEGEEATVFSFMSAPPGYNMETMLEVWRRIDPVLSGRVGAAADQQADGGFPPLRVNLSFIRPGFIRFVTEPMDPADTDALIATITRRMREIPGMRAFAARGSIFSGNSGGARAISLELGGGDLRTLYATALTVLDRAGDLFPDGQVNSDPSPPTLAMSQPFLELHPDWDRAGEMGIGLTELGYTLRAYSDGAFADEYLLDDEKLDIQLRIADGAARDRRGFADLMLHTGRGTPVPLSSLAELRETVGSSSITRVDGLRTVTLTIIPPRSVALETGIETVRRELVDALRAEGVIPDGMITRIAGAGGSLDELRSAMSGGFLLAIAITYLVLVAVFAHWGYPLIIIAVVPTGIGGGLIGLWLYNAAAGLWEGFGTPQPFDVLTMMGFLVLVGTVVNNPILIIEQAAENRRRLGMPGAEAITDALRSRMRPILITTVTSIAGVVPMVLVPSAGTELYRGLGLVVLWGLLVSTLVTVTVLPVVLSLVFRLSDRIAEAAQSRRVEIRS